MWNLPALRRLLEEILPNDDAFDDLSMDADFPGVGRRHMLLNGRRLDHVQLILLAIEDVTNRRRAEQGQEILFYESQHRIKNLFSSVSAILHLTRKGAGSVEDFVARFSDRLNSLARTQDVLSQAPADGTDLRELVEAEMEAHGVLPDGQVKIEGEPIGLPQKTAQALAMVVHELATNGLKYGALAHGGRVHMSWARSANGERIVFRWRESGVPGGAPELGGGFGCKLIRDVVPHMLDGTSQLEATEDGVLCVIDVPLEKEEDRLAPDPGGSGRNKG